MKRTEILDRYSTDAYKNVRTDPEYNNRILYPFGNLIRRASGSPVILDLASGKGEAADFLERSFSMSVVRGDLSLEGLSLGRNSRVRALADCLPFASESFDGIHMKDALVHMHDTNLLFSEISRVLKPAGKMLLVSAYPSRFSNFFYREEGDERSRSVRIYGQEDYEKTVKTLVQKTSVSTISSPYFINDPETVERSASSNGLSLTCIGEWTPINPLDWYKESPRPVNRYVMLFEKK